MSEKHCFFPSIENRDDMLNPANNKLTDVLEEANRLFANGNICLFTLHQQMKKKKLSHLLQYKHSVMLCVYFLCIPFPVGL